MDVKAAEARFFSSLQMWQEPQAQRRDRVLEATTDVDAVVDRLFDELLGYRSLPPR